MPNDDKPNAMKIAFFIAEARTDGAAREEAELVRAIPSRDRGRRIQGIRRSQMMTSISSPSLRRKSI